MFSRHWLVLGAFTGLLTLTACAGVAGGDSTVPPPAVEAATPTPTPTPLSIRDIDLGTGSVLFSPGGLSVPVTLEFAAGSATSELGSFTMGDPLYSDADGDGSEDALVAIDKTDGNGFESLWYIFLADGDGSAVQVPAPLARTARCGDLVEAASVAPNGGFVLDIVKRIRFQDDAVPCSEPGTGRERRVITVPGGVESPWPVQVEPVLAWGGICPGTEWMDTEGDSLQLLALPDESSAVANPEGTVVGVFPPLEDPTQLLAGGGLDASAWAFVVFIGEAASAPGAQCAWAPRQS